MKSSDDDVTSAVDDFIEQLHSLFPRRRKKCVDPKRDC